MRSAGRAAARTLLSHSLSCRLCSTGCYPKKFTLESINFHGFYSYLGMDSLYIMTEAKGRLVAYYSVCSLKQQQKYSEGGRTGRCRPGMKYPPPCRVEETQSSRAGGPGLQHCTKQHYHALPPHLIL